MAQRVVQKYLLEVTHDELFLMQAALFMQLDSNMGRRLEVGELLLEKLDTLSLMDIETLMRKIQDLHAAMHQQGECPSTRGEET